MIRVPETLNLALHAAGVLAVSGEGRSLTVAQLAAKLGVSENHLAKVMQRLARHKLVTSRRGPQGGFALARPAAKIRLLDIYEAVEGPLDPPACLLASDLCHGEGCLMGDLLHDLRAQIQDHFSRTTLASLPWPHLNIDP